MPSSGKTRRALVIGIDGARGDLIYNQAWVQQRAPNLQKLMASGKFAVCKDVYDTQCARTHSGPKTGRGFQWLTAPGWASVLTGVDNSKTQVFDNRDASFLNFMKSTKTYPTFLKRLRDEAGVKVAASGVGAFMVSAHKKDIKAGIVDYECDSPEARTMRISPAMTSSCNLDERRAGNSDDSKRDSKMTEWMKQQMANPQMGLVMGVFDQVDEAGHEHGFGSNKYYTGAIAATDGLIGDLMTVVKTRALQEGEEWLVILTSDHGGHRLLTFGMHDTWPDHDTAVPFVVATLGISLPPLKDLTYPVTQMDTHATVMQWFGKESPKSDGRVQGL